MPINTQDATSTEGGGQRENFTAPAGTGVVILAVEPLARNWNLPILKQLGCDCGCSSMGDDLIRR